MSNAMIKKLTAADVEPLTTDREVLLIDARMPFDYFGGHVPGAKNYPAAAVVGRLKGAPADRPIVVICDDGRTSAEVAETLQSNGFSDVSILDGGYDAWVEADYPTETISDAVLR
jgi:rhodanese-related sulfurtransferase